MTFPGGNLVLGSYCGPSIDVGPALTENIPRNNEQQVHRSTYRSLKPYESVNPDDIKARDEIYTATGEKLGPAESAKYFESDPRIVTPTLDRYDDDEEHHTHMPEVDEIMPKAMENYIGAEIMLSCGEIVSQGSVRLRKRDVGGNTFGRANSNPVLDPRSYEVEFEDGSISNYSENVIA